MRSIKSQYRFKKSWEFERRWGIDQGLFLSCVALALIVICLFVLFGLMDVKVPDVPLMVGTFLKGS